MTETQKSNHHGQAGWLRTTSLTACHDMKSSQWPSIFCRRLVARCSRRWVFSTTLADRGVASSASLSLPRNDCRCLHSTHHMHIASLTSHSSLATLLLK